MEDNGTKSGVNLEEFNPLFEQPISDTGLYKKLL